MLIRNVPLAPAVVVRFIPIIASKAVALMVMLATPAPLTLVPFVRLRQVRFMGGVLSMLISFTTETFVSVVLELEELKAVIFIIYELLLSGKEPLALFH